ncbi:penicillin binding protein PBP4B [Bacillus gobiensis]|uniref:penicillin binding protein PBP4B n=1 Tax=Bacillus gobiensis TaxID=1441095 RepID=UPI003D1A4920
MKRFTTGSVCFLLMISITMPAFASRYSLTSLNLDLTQEENSPILKKTKRPEETGFSSEKLKKVDQLIKNDIKDGFPGAAIVIIKDGKIVKSDQYGYKKKYEGTELLKHPAKMKKDTLFDLASNTKMYATNFALQRLVSEGKLDLYEKIQHYLPEFKDNEDDPIKGKNDLKIIDILHHSAGFPASIHFHNPESAGEFYSQDREKTLSLLPKIPLIYEPGTEHIYSDIDYMLLGLIVETITGKPMDEYLEHEFYQPLGLKNTMFNPLQKGFEAKDFAATELIGNTREGMFYFPNVREYTLQGEVHDEKAFYSMDGVSGHAGLFSTTEDLAVLLQTMLNGGGYGKTKLFDQETIDQFVQPSETDSTYGLGWRRNGSSSMEWMFGPYASEHAYGHTGWTGTVTIIDPEFDLGIVLLTNKKHSRIINPLENPNFFEGDEFPTGQYGEVVSAVYEALERR